jgi:hypothetical protein
MAEKPGNADEIDSPEFLAGRCESCAETNSLVHHRNLFCAPDGNKHVTELEKLESNSEATASEADPQPKRRRRTWIGFFRDLFLYCVLYLVISGISIGPMFWVWFGAAYADGPKWVYRVYQPLALLCEICPPLGRLINAWVNWWIL